MANIEWCSCYVQKTNLGGSLGGFSGTVFAPSNSAFDKLLGLLELSKDQFFAGNAQVIEQVGRRAVGCLWMNYYLVMYISTAAALDILPHGSSLTRGPLIYDL